MTYTPNVFQDRLKPAYGLPTVMPVQPGESFDWANDCFLSHDGMRIEFRADWPAIEIPGGRVGSAMCDALKVWNRHYLSASEFSDHYGDDPTECGFGGE